MNKHPSKRKNSRVTRMGAARICFRTMSPMERREQVRASTQDKFQLHEVRPVRNSLYWVNKNQISDAFNIGRQA